MIELHVLLDTPKGYRWEMAEWFYISSFIDYIDAQTENTFSSESASSLNQTKLYNQRTYWDAFFYHRFDETTQKEVLRILNDCQKTFLWESSQQSFALVSFFLSFLLFCCYGT
eukprot:TRINITY_DN4027_c0_g1_i2.p1 TRINITY_DN4027_c0_g1~~TRINITY_DN4027_c0_g1_i2.p1  ORF type:complete len:113 (-),score=21.83 TRINITY_DN4027_c0_g1_i2:902-1240(-)